MTKFEDCIQYILDNEGEEYTNDPRDMGGCTKWGVTLHDCLMLASCGIRTCEELKYMPVSTAKTIYYALYWKFGSIDDRRVATKMLDMYVNMGGSANILFQRAAVACGQAVKVDGMIGPETELAINTIVPDAYLAELVDQSYTYYNRIVEHNPRQAVFIKGWLTRAEKLPA